MANAITTFEVWKNRLTTATYVSLLALVCIAPFEYQKSVASLAGLQLTNVEIALGIAILLGCVRRFFTSDHFTLRIALAKPVILLLAAMLVSTLAASGHRGEAIRFVGRFSGGFCLCLLTANLLTARHRFLGLTKTGLAVGSLVAFLGILEYFEFELAPQWLDAFKPGPFYAGGLVRASSTLQYPTIASMYLEIIFGFGLGLLVFSLTSSPRRRSFLPFLSLLAVALGIMVTLTRGGLITLAVQLSLTLALYFGRRRVDRGFWVLSSLLLLTATLVLGLWHASPTYLVRLKTQSPKGWYKAGFEVPGRLEFSPGEIREVHLSVTNLGEVIWRPDGPYPFRVSYHWLDNEKENVVVFEGHRSVLPAPVAPGSSLSMKARVEAPLRPGKYQLAWDIVQEGRLWFGSETGMYAYSTAFVKGEEEPMRPMFVEGPPLPISESRYQLDRLSLWKGVLLILVDRPLVGVGPGNFRFFYGDYLGLETWNRSLHANNTFLEFFAGTGLLGGLFYLWLWLTLFKLLVQSWKRGVKPSLPFLVSATGAVSAIFVHGMVDDFFSFTPTYIMIWLSFAAVAALSGIDAKSQRTD